MDIKGDWIMSNKELAIQLLDRIPEYKMYYIIGILEGAAIPEENAMTNSLLSESSLAKDWLSDEEDIAWRDL